MFGWNVCETELLTQWTICLSHESDFLDWCICVETLWQTMIRNERWNFERQCDRLNFPFQFHTEVDGTKWQTCETVLCWCAAGASSSFTIPQSTKTQDPHQKQAAETRSRKTWVTFLAVYCLQIRFQAQKLSLLYLKLTGTSAGVSPLSSVHSLLADLSCVQKGISEKNNTKLILANTMTFTG